MKMKYKGIFLADVHIGAFPIAHLQQEMEEGLLAYIQTHDVDFVIFGGDYFDHKLYLNDPAASYATTLLYQVDQILKPEAKIRMVYGTEGHDSNQYDSFNVLKDHRDFQVIKYVKEEELYPDMKVLYLPEESLYDSTEYYKDYFEKTGYYDLICGHGVIQEIMKEAAASIEDRKNVSRKVPVFRTGTLRRICRGLTLFGHYHIHQDFDDTVMYVGSYSRWKFGEEEPKGFLSLVYDTEKEEPWTWEFIENTFASIYKTVGFGYQNTMFSSMEEMKEKMDHYERLTESKTFDHLRLEFNIPEDCENAESYMEYLRERFRNVPEIKVNIKNGYIEKKKEQTKKAMESQYAKYAPLFEPSMKMEDQASYFVDVEYNRKISPEQAAKYLYESLESVLAEN